MNFFCSPINRANCNTNSYSCCSSKDVSCEMICWIFILIMQPFTSPTSNNWGCLCHPWTEHNQTVIRLCCDTTTYTKSWEIRWTSITRSLTSSSSSHGESKPGVCTAWNKANSSPTPIKWWPCAVCSVKTPRQNLMIGHCIFSWSFCVCHNFVNLISVAVYHFFKFKIFRNFHPVHMYTCIVMSRSNFTWITQEDKFTARKALAFLDMNAS